MIVLLSVAFAQDCPPAPEALQSLRADPTPETYRCAIALGPEALVDAAAEPLPHPERVTRALAVHRLENLDEAITPEEAWTYRPADVRLVADGIHAHRGRKSPSEAHLVVFDQMDWYVPNPQYTDALLTDTDRANIEMLKNPPVPTEEPSAADAMASSEGAPEKSVGCGCAVGATGLPALSALAGLMLWRRRGRAPSAGTGRDGSLPRA